MAKQLIGMSRLLQLEQEIRQASSIEVLSFIAVNDIYRVVPFDHAVFWQARSGRITAVSGALKIEDTAAQIDWLTRLAAHLAERPGSEPAAVVPDDLPIRFKADAARYLSGRALALPLDGPRATRWGLLILMRADEFNEVETKLFARLGSALGTTAAALAGPRPVSPARMRRRELIVAALVVSGLAMLVPVRLSVLADARVVPIDPVVITAPIEGVIQSIRIRPNDRVEAGDKLLEFDPRELAATREVALKRVAVLSAEARRAEEKAFVDPDARAELARRRAELAEGETELAYAAERLSRVSVVAPERGIALFEDPQDLIGRPMKIGERIMQIADPKAAKLEVHLSAEDASVVSPGSEVELFLATAPRSPVPARLTKLSYTPRNLPNQTLAFFADAAFAGNDMPRLGLTGTAKVYGEKAPLYYILCRKPLAWLRRVTGF